jgi:hypothetical protein
MLLTSAQIDTVKIECNFQQEVTVHILVSNTVFFSFSH